MSVEVAANFYRAHLLVFGAFLTAFFISSADGLSYASDLNFWPVLVELKDCDHACSVPAKVEAGTRTEYVPVPFIQSVGRYSLTAGCRCVAINRTASAVGPCKLSHNEFYMKNYKDGFGGAAVCIQWKCDRFCHRMHSLPGICWQYLREDVVVCTCVSPYAQPIRVELNMQLHGKKRGSYIQKIDESHVNAMGMTVDNGILRCKVAECHEYCNFAYGNGNPARAAEQTQARGECRVYGAQVDGSAQPNAQIGYCACMITARRGQDYRHTGDVAQVTSQCHVFKPERDQALVFCDATDCARHCGAKHWAKKKCENTAEQAIALCASTTWTGVCRNYTKWAGTERPLDTTNWVFPFGKHHQRIACVCKEVTASPITTTPAAETLAAPGER